MEDLLLIQAKQYGLIPEYLWHMIPDKCAIESGGCGSYLMTTRNLTKQWCSNPRCIKKLAAMSAKCIQEKFGYDGVGVGYFTKFFENNRQYDTHLAIFVAPKEQLYKTREIENTDNFLEIRKEILSRRYLFSELVAKMCFPNLDSTALTIFNKFMTINVLEEYLRLQNISMKKYLTSFYGIKNKKADTIMKTIEIFHKDIEWLPKIFKLKTYPKENLVIAITGSPDYNYMTKKEFIAHLNRIGNNKVHISFTDSALKSCDYIVCSTANEYMVNSEGDFILDKEGNRVIQRGTAKKNIGIERNKTDGYKVLVSPVEMKNIVKNLLMEVEDNE